MSMARCVLLMLAVFLGCLIGTWAGLYQMSHKTVEMEPVALHPSVVTRDEEGQ